MLKAPSHNLNGLQHEWGILQSQFDSYEKYSLVIKLVTLVLFFGAFLAATSALISALLVLILWFQDGIWKTFQGRIYQRLLNIEKAMSEGLDDKAMQFNRHWQENRPTHIGLLAEYLRTSCKPTVAYPYAVLLICSIVF